MKVLSIEIGTDFTHVVEMDYRIKNPKIYNSLVFSTPKDMVGNTLVKENDDFRNILLAKLLQRNITTKKVVFVINSEKIANREVEIPMVKDNQISGLLHTNSKDYFPVDLDQYQLAYYKLGENKQEKKMRLLVYAVPYELTRSYEKLCDFCNLELVTLDCVGNSMFQVLRRVAKDRVTCGIKIDENQAVVTIVNQGELEMQRTVFYGYGSITSLVEGKDEFNASADGLKDYMKWNDCMDGEARVALQQLANGVQRVINYYLSQSAHAAIDEILLLGEGSTIKGMDAYFTELMHLRVEQLGVHHIGESQIPGTSEMAEIVIAYGATLNPLTIALGKKHKTKISEKQEENMVLASRIIALAGVFVAVILVGVSGISYLIARGQENKLRTERKELQPIQDLYEEYELTAGRYNDVMLMDMQMFAMSNDFVAVIEEMEEKLPSNIDIKTISSDNYGVTITMEVLTKEEAATVLRQLETFDVFSDVTTTSLAHSADEDNENVLTFSVVCTYAGGFGEAPDMDSLTNQTITEAGGAQNE